MSDEATSPKISVVVPIYKVEKYLRDCVESILAQTFTDFELILVDDGSPDKCGEICDELAKQDPRIRVFHQANRGVTSARRLGVEQARGEWITFVDADDLLPKDAFETLIEEATDYTDWVQGMHCNFDDGETPKEVARTGKVTSLDLVGIVENMLVHHIGPIAKLVRKNLFSPHVMDIPREMRMSEDPLMNLRLIANRPRKGKEIDKIVYFYRQQESSVCHTYVRAESYIFRYLKLLLAELRKITKPSNKERLSVALSRHLCTAITVSLIRHGLPIKFPHRLATLMRRGARTKRTYFFIYLCLRYNCLGIVRFLVKIYCPLRGISSGAKGKTPLE